MYEASTSNPFSRSNHHKVEVNNSIFVIILKHVTEIWCLINNTSSHHPPRRYETTNRRNKRKNFRINQKHIKNSIDSGMFPSCFLTWSHNNTPQAVHDITPKGRHKTFSSSILSLSTLGEIFFQTFKKLNTKDVILWAFPFSKFSVDFLVLFFFFVMDFFKVNALLFSGSSRNESHDSRQQTDGCWEYEWFLFYLVHLMSWRTCAPLSSAIKLYHSSAVGWKDGGGAWFADMRESFLRCIRESFHFVVGDRKRNKFQENNKAINLRCRK